MAFGHDMLDVLRAIPPRIEVAGHGPTVRVTAGSFDDALEYARTAYDDPVVLAVAVRRRLWPRVALTVTTDPVLARSAPPLASLRERAEADLAARTEARRESRPGPAPRTEPTTRAAGPEDGSRHASGLDFLEEVFARQDARRGQRPQVPAQRRTRG